MGYTTFANNGQPAINDANLNLMQVELMKMVFPIGSTYITQTNQNPSTILNFGTWERLKGKVFLGLDEDDENFNVIGKTGGETKHILTIDEMPNHSHKIRYNENSFGAGDYTNNSLRGTEDGDISGTKLAEGNGGGQPHNNLQPYEVVGYMWIRRS